MGRNASAEIRCLDYERSAPGLASSQTAPLKLAFRQVTLRPKAPHPRGKPASDLSRPRCYRLQQKCGEHHRYDAQR